MTDDSNSNTRPISVAELLAKNGTIGAPPVGGRRRRRRGNADAVTVAELTGEIPIIRPDDPPPVAPPVPEAVDDVYVDEAPEEPGDSLDEAETAATNGEVDHVAEPETDETDEVVEETDEGAEAEVAEPAETDEAQQDDETGPTDETDDDYADAVAAYSAKMQQRDSDAETWTPDAVGDSVDVEATDELDEPVDIEALDAEIAVDEDAKSPDDDAVGTDDDRDELPSYLRSTEEPLFGGQSVADELILRGGRSSLDEDRDDDDDDVDDPDAEPDEPRQMSPLVHGLWIVGQSIIAVVFGAGLFVAFDQLWKWNNIVALVLSVLVILGLVVGVRVVRKTEDIGSTLIAVAVGALVTLGPLALLQSG